MSKQAYDKIAEGLKEAIAVARGKEKPAKLFKVDGEAEVYRERDSDEPWIFRCPHCGDEMRTVEETDDGVIFTRVLVCDKCEKRGP